MLGRLVAKNLLRPFSSSTTPILPTVEKFVDTFTVNSLELYKKSKVEVDKELDKVR
jgi:hypothetical protein